MVCTCTHSCTHTHTCTHTTHMHTPHAHTHTHTHTHMQTHTHAHTHIHTQRHDPKVGLKTYKQFHKFTIRCKVGLDKLDLSCFGQTGNVDSCCIRECSTKASDGLSGLVFIHLQHHCNLKTHKHIAYKLCYKQHVKQRHMNNWFLVPSQP